MTTPAPLPDDVTEEEILNGVIRGCRSNHEPSIIAARRIIEEFSKLSQPHQLAMLLELMRDYYDDTMASDAVECPDGLLPDGPICPKCGKNRAPSGVGGGTWVHFTASNSEASPVESQQ